MSTSPATRDVGFVVDAGPGVGYGHVVRSLRVAGRLREDAGVGVSFFPLSNACGRFLAVRDAVVRSDTDFPGLMVSDLPRPHPFVDAIARHGCRHIGIRDLGLAQCDADVMIDGSITTVLPYDARPDRQLFTGPKYMVTSPGTPARRPARDVVFVTLGGGESSAYTPGLVSELTRSGFEVYATTGFRNGPPTRVAGAIWVTGDREIATAMSRATVAVTTSGVSLYEMLAASIPTIALGVDEYQLRTASAFQAEDAIEAMGLVADTRPPEIVECVRRLASDDGRKRRLVENGRRLVDGRGLSRVSAIVRKELCRKESN